MIKIVITVEGNTEELAPVLRYLSDMSVGMRVEETRQETPAPVEEIEPMYWTEAKVRKIWRALTFECEEVLKEIAKHEDGISWDQLLTSLKLKPNQVGGRLSSLGHQLRIHGYNILPAPLKLTTDPGGYKMDTVWRRTILKIQEDHRGGKDF